MNDSQAIQHSGPGPKRVDDQMREQEDLWRRAEDNSMPLSEKIAHASFAAIILAFSLLYLLGTIDSPPITFMILWFVALSSSRYLRQQKQIDALRELLRRAAGRR